MRKKTLALLLVVSCTLSMAACGESGNGGTSVSGENGAGDELAQESHREEEAADEKHEEGTKEEGADKKAVTPPSGLSNDLYDFQISIDGTVYRFPMWYSEFEALGWEFLGDPTETLDADERGFNAMWMKDGIQVGTSFFNPSVNTIPYSESIVWNIYLNSLPLIYCDWDIILPGGIQWKVSGYDDIIAAYGTPYHEVESSVSYHLTYGDDSHHQVSLNVSKEEDVLEEIEIINLEELDGLDNSVNSEVPDFVKAYQAPESLSDDFNAFTLQLEDVVYTLPCPVSVLLENGFTVDTAKSDDELGAGAAGSVALRYDDLTLYAEVKNHADYATMIENCFIVELEASIFNNAGFDIVFPGSIKIGDSESALRQALKEVDYEKAKDGDYTYYWMEDRDKSVLETYTFIVSDGRIILMDMRYTEKPNY